MTSANGGTYAGQYPCDGWVDSLEPTLLITVILFLIKRHNEENRYDSLVNYLQDKTLIIPY